MDARGDLYFRRRTRIGHRQSIVGVLAAGAVLCGLSACAGPALADTGDCVEPSGESSYTTADCAGAQLRVLERIESSGADCATVAGVTESYTDVGAGYALCIGPLDVDQATAINVAEVGDCLADLNGDARQADCGDPMAQARVLGRDEDQLDLGPECADWPSSTSSYSWDLKETTSTGPFSDIDSIDIVFCLGPVGLDPQSSIDNAQVGDCLRETGDVAEYAVVDCGAPDARYRVLGRVDALPSISAACQSVRGTTSGVTRGDVLDGYVLCLARN